MIRHSKNAEIYLLDQDMRRFLITLESSSLCDKYNMHYAFYKDDGSYFEEGIEYVEFKTDNYYVDISDIISFYKAVING